MRKRFQLLLPLVVAGLLVASDRAGARAESVTLVVNTDTAITESAPENNLGHSWLAAGLDDWGHRSRALLKFSLPITIPKDVIITNVRLVLAVTQTPHSFAGSPEFSLHRLTRPWEAGCLGSPVRDDWGNLASLCPPPTCAACATWLSTGLENWSTPGGAPSFDFHHAASGMTRITGSVLIFDNQAGLRQDVQYWLANGVSNHGWMLMATDETRWNSLRRFGSLEDTATAPRLTITYTTPPPTPPAIVSEPRDTQAPTGGNATFSVVATGTPPLAYQWYRNQLPVPLATSDLLILQNLTKDRSGTYAVHVRNAAGSVASANADLTVLDPPKIITHPVGGPVLPEATASLQVEVTGDELSYQWLQNGQPIIGATDWTLAIDAFQASDTGTYVVRVTNPVGVAQSNPVVLTLVRAPEIQRIQFEAGEVRFEFAVQAGVPCVVEYSESLPAVAWERLIRVSSPHSPMIFPVRDRPAGRPRYYQVRTD